MQVNSIYNPIKNCVKYMRNMFTSKPVAVNSTVVQGSEILADQNKILVKRASNFVEPLQNSFKSTKEMFNYAKNRCIASLNSEGNPEHAVVMDLKNNKVLAEYIGNKETCNLYGFETLDINPEYTAVMHGHINSYPISTTDVNFLLNQNVNQVIAVDTNGQYSLVSKRPDCNYANKFIRKEFANYNNEAYDCKYSFGEKIESSLYKIFIHAILKEHAQKMNIRYWTNYGFLKS